jgi:prepilin-type N-terminal cleavage/methylation domain-containing protein
MTHAEQRQTPTGSKQSPGFTLVEMMIVMAIIALLGAISIPLYNGYVTSAEGTATRANAEPLRLALEDHFLENSTYVTGDWIPDGAKTLQTGALGWNPDGDKSNHDYRVVAGPTGTIATSYVMTVSSRSNTSIVTTCTRIQTEGIFNCTTSG